IIELTFQNGKILDDKNYIFENLSELTNTLNKQALNDNNIKAKNIELENSYNVMLKENQKYKEKSSEIAVILIEKNKEIEILSKQNQILMNEKRTLKQQLSEAVSNLANHKIQANPDELSKIEESIKELKMNLKKLSDSIDKTIKREIDIMHNNSHTIIRALNVKINRIAEELGNFYDQREKNNTERLKNQLLAAESLANQRFVSEVCAKAELDTQRVLLLETQRKFQDLMNENIKLRRKFNQLT
ncbi:MAG: hypothetical protein MHPSP_004178, partial [Paramarteilia canceri]